MNDNKKLIAWGVLGVSLLIWLFFRDRHPMVTPVLLGLTVVVLLREIGPLRFACLPFYAGVLLLIGNIFIEPLDEAMRASLGLTGVALVLLAFFLGRRKSRTEPGMGADDSPGNDT